MKPLDNPGPRRGTPSGDEDDSTMPLLVSRVSDRFVVNEQTSKHYTRPYSYYEHRGGWGSPNSSYDPRGESSVQHRPVNDSWHHPEVPHPTYDPHHIPSDDPYRRGIRDDYIRTEDSRSSWPEVRPPEDSRYPPSGREWPERYAPPAHADWPTHGDRGPTHYQRQGRPDWRQEGKGWHRDDGRSEGWRTNDSWEPRHGGHTSRQPADWKRRDFQNDRSQRNAEDRTWQPSASWQSSSRGGGGGQGQRNQNQRRYQNRDRSGRGGKKGRYNHQQRRDFRPDDSHLNNWTKRDGSGKASKKDTLKERQQRHSPSRSRSPGVSSHSYPSERSRSPSQSLSPQRRQRDSSIPNNRSHTPTPPVDDRHKRRYSPSHSASPERPSSPLRPLSPNGSPTRKGKSPSRDENPRHGRSHKRTYSPVSRSSSSGSRSRSRSRSVSLSPAERPRPVHRLPTTTSIQDINMPSPSRAVQRNQNQPKLLPRDNGWPKRERGRPNGHARGSRRPVQDYSVETMPPPALPPQVPYQGHNDAAHTEEHQSSQEIPTLSHPRDDLLVPAPHVSRHGHTPPTHPPIDDIQHNRPPHQSPVPSRLTPASMPPFKVGGFKPIGQASSAVRKFFPGDEDEREDAEKRHPSPMLIPAPHYRPPAPAPLVHNGQVPFIPSESFHRTHYDPASRSPYSVSSRPLGDSPVHPTSYSGPDDKMLERPPPHDYAHYYGHEQGQHHHDQHGPVYYRDEQHFSIHNGHEYPPPHDQEDARPRDPDFSHTGEPEMTRPSTPNKSSSDELYSIVSQVGEGTFGKVYKAQNTVSGLYVALKRIRMESERDGFPVTAMREIKLLQSLRHDNIVRLYEMMVSNGSVYMVFEYMDHDLTGILSQSQFTFSDAHLKSLCEQMLAGLAYLHHKGIIHRDIKGSNILVNNRGELKLGDFGLARFYHKRRRSDYTNRVITLWYRPPELLFGTTVYGPEVDMWSAGCIMLELFTKKPIFQGNDEIHQLECVFRLLGTPTPERWPGVTNLPWYELVKPKEAIPNHFRDLFRKWLSPAGLDLAEKLLAFDPLHRIAAVQALEAAYFKVEEPPPAMPTGLSSLEGEWHELETKRERAKKRRKVEGGAAQ